MKAPIPPPLPQLPISLLLTREPFVRVRSCKVPRARTKGVRRPLQSALRMRYSPPFVPTSKSFRMIEFFSRDEIFFLTLTSDIFLSGSSSPFPVGRPSSSLLSPLPWPNLSPVRVFQAAFFFTLTSARQSTLFFGSISSPQRMSFPARALNGPSTSRSPCLAPFNDGQPASLPPNPVVVYWTSGNLSSQRMDGWSAYFSSQKYLSLFFKFSCCHEPPLRYKHPRRFHQIR